MKTFLEISPILRHVKIKDCLVIKKWIDYDHVYSYIKEGESYYYVNGVEYHLKKGNSIIIPAFAPHTIKTYNPDNYIEYSFHFDLYYNEQRVHYNEYYREMNKIPKLPVKENNIKSIMPIAIYDNYKSLEIENLFEKLIMAKGNAHNYKQIIYKAVGMHIIMEHILNSAKMKRSVTKPSWKHVKLAIDFIHDSYNNSELNVKLISEKVGVSESYLSRLFVQYTGIPVYKYLLKARLEESKKILLNEKLNISEVALKVGFDSIHSFSKAFKNNYNISPTEYITNNI